MPLPFDPGHRAYVWVDNDTGGNLTVQIVGVAQRSFSPGYHYWRSVSPGRYTVKAWARCGSATNTWDFVAGENELTYWCTYSSTLGSEEVSTHGAHEAHGVWDLRSVR